MLRSARQTDSALIRPSEGSGTTTLDKDSNRSQMFNLSAARTCVLPTTGIKAGDVYVIENQGTFTLTVQSSALATIGIVDSLQSTLICTALQDAPSTAAHWRVRLDYAQRVYSHGTTYNGGIAPTITLSSGGGSLSSVNSSEFIPYQTPDGNWRCRFNFNLTVTAVARTALRIAVNGFASSATANQGIITVPNSASVFSQGLSETSGTLLAQHPSSTETQYSFQGDIRLASKPTWAY